MARNFRRTHAAQPIAELNVTNLIDLGFMLLIIFMIVTPLIQQEQTIPVNLPTESTSPQQKVDPKAKFHSVSVDANGRYYVDEDKTPLSLPTLRARLRAFSTEKEKPVIRLRIDAKATGQHFITIMDELKKLDLTKWNFDTRTEP
jgi:biopolymer transport protein ExbD